MPNIKKKILIVDDNADALDLAYVQLTQVGGYTCETALNAGQVINILEEKCKQHETCFNLILIDIDLQDVRGTTLAKFLCLFRKLC
jgi:CheY-like chemotaxis protein